MRFWAFAAVLGAWLAGGPAFADDACVRPAAPGFPPTLAARLLSAERIETLRGARDDYFTAMDAYLDCVNGEIETRMRALLGSGSGGDDGLAALAEEHRSASEERAGVYERFSRLCLAWEDARKAPLPGRCGLQIVEPTAAPPASKPN